MYPDRELILAAAQLDAVAITTLYGRYSPMVRTIAAGFVSDQDAVDDLCQDVWLIVLKRLPQVQQPNFFPLWLHRVAITTALQHVRAVKRRDSGMSRLALYMQQYEAAPSPLLRIDLERAANELPSRMRELIYRSLSGQTLDALAVDMGITVGTAKSQMHKARRKLRTRLQTYH